jgi:hypothetical protein
VGGRGLIARRRGWQGTCAQEQRSGRDGTRSLANPFINQMFVPYSPTILNTSSQTHTKPTQCNKLILIPS